MTRTFDPDSVGVHVGDEVEWDNTGQFLTHTATSDAGFFDTGTVDPGGTHQVLFRFGGAFPYHCLIHGPSMHGTVKVLDQWLNTGTQHVGDVQRIRLATGNSVPNGLAFDVQMRATGGDWHVFSSKVRQLIVKFTPTAAGEYRFRSRLHVLANNKVSGFSPALAVEISS